MRDVPRDLVDRRDEIYLPSLRPLQPRLYPDQALIKVLNSEVSLLPRSQGDEGTCTGHALATLIDLQRMLHPHPSDDGKPEPSPPEPVSARMLYEMSRLHSEAPAGEGSSLRAVIKGFYHHGVCHEASWEYVANDPRGTLNVARAKEARSVPLGAYYRLRPMLNDYHAALNEVGPILVSAATHSGWDFARIQANGGRIFPFPDERGGHAFVVIGYDSEGFLVLNSWGADWGGVEGLRGVGHWSYQDWADSIYDGWVLRLGVPAPGAFDLTLGEQGLNFMRPAGRSVGTPGHEVLGHMAHLDDGSAVDRGAYAFNATTFEETVRYLRGKGQDGENTAVPVARAWDPEALPDKRGYRGILLRFGGSLLGLKDIAAQVAREKPLAKLHGLYPFTIVWCNDFVEQSTLVLDELFVEAMRQIGHRGDVLDRLLEERIHGIGRAFWRDVRAASRKSARSGGPAMTILEQFAGLHQYRLHLVADGAGMLLLCDLLRTLAAMPQGHAEKVLPRIASLDMITPTIDRTEFERHFAPLVRQLAGGGLLPGNAEPCVLHVPTPATEAKLTVGHYSSSILDLIENAFSDRASARPNLIGKSAARSGVRRRWKCLGRGFNAIAIENIDVGVEAGKALRLEDLQARTNLFARILRRVAPLPNATTI